MSSWSSDWLNLVVHFFRSPPFYPNTQKNTCAVQTVFVFKIEFLLYVGFKPIIMTFVAAFPIQILSYHKVEKTNITMDSSVVVLEPPDNDLSWGNKTNLNFDFDGKVARVKFREFFRNFRLDNIYLYRESLIRNWNRNLFYIEVDCAHISEFDEVLLHHLQVR